MFRALADDLARGVCTYDLHVHSDVSDGRDSPEAMLDAAAPAGLRVIAMTEHVRRDTNWFGEFADRVQAWSRQDVRALVGCETKALDHSGTIDAPESALKRCDVVLGSVHRVPDEYGTILEPRELAPERLLELEHRAAAGLIRGGAIDVLSHQGGMYRRHVGEYPADLVDELIDLAVRNEVAFEISAKYHADLRGLYDRLRSKGALVSVGSDAHGVEEVGRIRMALGLAS
jgi:putative hydrolase